MKKTVLIYSRLFAYGLFLLFLNVWNGYGQGQVNQTGASSVPMPNLTPQSPEATAMGKFGDIPVGLYTGVPNISVPIYQMKLKGLTIPVSIDYHSSGVKVDELATNVGLDWVLSTGGGMISQIIYGNSDFNGWLNSQYTNPQTGLLQTAFYVDPSNPVSYDTSPAYVFNNNSASGVIDTQPDVFTYSIPGKSGKFFFDQGGTIHLMPYQNIKIDCTFASTGAPLQYVITDETGNKFYFTVIELTQTTTTPCTGSLSSGVSPFNVTFYLSKIVTPLNEEVDFHYATFNYTTQNQISETRYWGSRAPQPGGPNCDIIQNCVSTSSTLNSTLSVSDITNVTTGEKVVFTYDTVDRLDLPGAKALNRIEVFNSNNVSVKKFDLTHDYFTAFPQSSTTSLNSRLRLTQIQQNGQQPYIFTYNVTPLPARLSFGQDFWGYYNGANSNTTLLPNENSPYFPDGANRQPDTAYMKAGVLTKMTYPTGGYTYFDYEGNDSYENQTVGSFLNESAGGGATLNQTNTINFTVPDNSLDFQVQWGISADGSTSGGLNLDGNNTQIILSGGPGNIINNTFNGNSNGIEKLFSYSSEQAALPPGNYTITITNTDPDGTGPATGGIIIYWKTQVNQLVQQNQLAGGLRIKSMIDYPVTGQGKATHFEYNDPANPSQSSGVLLYPVVYDYPYYKDHLDPVSQMYTICTYIAQNGTSQTPLGSVQGQNVIYKYVTAYTGDKTDGYTLNQFTAGDAATVVPFSDGLIPPYPFPPSQTPDWLEGLPVSTTQLKYNTATGTYFPISINQKNYKTQIGNGISNFYDSNPANSHEFYVRGIKIVYQHPDEPFTQATLVSGQLPADQFAIGYYHLYSSWYHLDSETNTIYDANGQNPVITTTNYYYDNPTHIQLTRNVTTNSRGKVLTSVTTYPDDYAAGTTFLDDMKTNHEVAFPIEQVSYQDDESGTKIFGGTITQYQTGGKALVDRIFKFESAIPVILSSFKFSDRATAQLPYSTSPSVFGLDAHYQPTQPRLVYNLYDNIGNPLTLTPQNAPAVSYQWGYNQQYPVAECKNASRTEFYYEGFEESTASGLQTTSGHTGNNFNTNPSVSWTLPNARAYVISYWYLSGGTWHYSGEQPFTGSFTMQLGASGYDDIRIYPADAQMTTYTYNPLIGMTSSTDTKGETTYYEYDSFQRLMNVRDKDGNILKHTDYHYQNQ